MTIQFSKRKRRGLWWISVVLIVALLFGTGTWFVGASAKIRLMEQYPAPGQMVDVGGFNWWF